MKKSSVSFQDPTEAQVSSSDGTYQTYSAALWDQCEWTDKTDNEAKITISDPDTATLLSKCILYLVGLALFSKQGLEEAYSEILEINQFYSDKQKFLDQKQEETKPKLRPLEIVTTEVKKPFVFEYDSE